MVRMAPAPYEAPPKPRRAVGDDVEAARVPGDLPVRLRTVPRRGERRPGARLVRCRAVGRRVLGCGAFVRGEGGGVFGRGGRFRRPRSAAPGVRTAAARAVP